MSVQAYDEISGTMVSYDRREPNVVRQGVRSRVVSGQARWKVRHSGLADVKTVMSEWKLTCHYVPLAGVPSSSWKKD